MPIWPNGSCSQSRNLLSRLLECGSPVTLWCVSKRKGLRPRVPFQSRATPWSRRTPSQSLGQIHVTVLSMQPQEGCTWEMVFPCSTCPRGCSQHLLHPLSSPSPSHHFATRTVRVRLFPPPPAPCDRGGTWNNPAAPSEDGGHTSLWEIQGVPVETSSSPQSDDDMNVSTQTNHFFQGFVTSSIVFFFFSLLWGWNYSDFVQKPALKCSGSGNLPLYF